MLLSCFSNQLSKSMEGLEEWLDALSTARIPCAVVSSLDRKSLVESLERMGVKKYFQVGEVISSWHIISLVVTTDRANYDETLPARLCYLIFLYWDSNLELNPNFKVIWMAIFRTLWWNLIDERRLIKIRYPSLFHSLEELSHKLIGFYKLHDKNIVLLILTIHK